MKLTSSGVLNSSDNTLLDTNGNVIGNAATATSAGYAASAGACTGNAATATSAGYAASAGACTGNAATATSAGYAASAGACTGNAATATSAGYAASAGSAPNQTFYYESLAGSGLYTLSEEQTNHDILILFNTNGSDRTLRPIAGNTLTISNAAYYNDGSKTYDSDGYSSGDTTSGLPFSGYSTFHFYRTSSTDHRCDVARKINNPSWG